MVHRYWLVLKYIVLLVKPIQSLVRDWLFWFQLSPLFKKKKKKTQSFIKNNKIQPSLLIVYLDFSNGKGSK